MLKLTFPSYADPNRFRLTHETSFVKGHTKSSTPIVFYAVRIFLAFVVLAISLPFVTLSYFNGSSVLMPLVPYLYHIINLKSNYFRLASFGISCILFKERTTILCGMDSSQ